MVFYEEPTKSWVLVGSGTDLVPGASKKGLGAKRVCGSKHGSSRNISRGLNTFWPYLPPVARKHMPEIIWAIFQAYIIFSWHLGSSVGVNFLSGFLCLNFLKYISVSSSHVQAGGLDMQEVKQGPYETCRSGYSWKPTAGSSCYTSQINTNLTHRDCDPKNQPGLLPCSVGHGTVHC